MSFQTFYIYNICNKQFNVGASGAGIQLDHFPVGVFAVVFVMDDHISLFEQGSKLLKRDIPPSSVPGDSVDEDAGFHRIPVCVDMKDKFLFRRLYGLSVFTFDVEALGKREDNAFIFQDYGINFVIMEFIVHSYSFTGQTMLSDVVRTESVPALKSQTVRIDFENIQKKLLIFIEKVVAFPEQIFICIIANIVLRSKCVVTLF